MASSNVGNFLMQNRKIFQTNINYEELFIEKNIALALPNLDYDIPSQSINDTLCSNFNIKHNNIYKYNSNIIIFSTISETPDLSKIIQSVGTNITIDL